MLAGKGVKEEASMGPPRDRGGGAWCRDYIGQSQVELQWGRLVIEAEARARRVGP